MSRTFTLPSGERCTRYYNRAEGGVRYALHGTPVVLSREDIEHLYAESISGDGGRELPAPPRDRGGCNLTGCCASCHYVVHGQ